MLLMDDAVDVHVDDGGDAAPSGGTWISSTALPKQTTQA